MFGRFTIPFPIEFDDSYSDIESVNQSEGGKDIVQNFRHGKFSADVSFAVSDDVWVRNMAELYDMDSFTIYFYSPALQDYDERIVRMRNFKPKRKKGSERLTAVNGVYEVSFTLEEF
jgi:hypothetical protein